MTVILNLRGKESTPIYHVKSMWRQDGKLYIQRKHIDFPKPDVYMFGKDFTYIETYWESDKFYGK